MKFSTAACAILAPALASAAAFAMSQPTQHRAVAADNWSPAPTAAPQFNLFGREALQATENNNTCGYISGLAASPVSCPNSKEICATNTFFGVHGCCDPANLSACTIATTCIPSTAMRTLCTDDSCTSNGAIAKCTASSAQECYKWLFADSTTTMTQHGCAPSGFTSTAQRTLGGPASQVKTVTVTASPSETPTSSPQTPSTTANKPSLGPIIGGTVGGCLIVSLVALTAFLIHRRRRAASQPPQSLSHSSPEFDPRGFSPAPWSPHDTKTWPYPSVVPDPGTPYLGVAEVHGNDRAVEVEAPEKTKAGGWTQPGFAPVEVEAPPREEKKRWWRGAVEAPT